MRILILNHSFRHFTGSEINALQLATGLTAMGHQAGIGTFEAGAPLLAHAARHGLAVHDLLRPEGPPLDYDVIWAHHAPVLTQVLFHREVRDCRLIFSTLSPLTAAESPPSYAGELALVLTHSPYNEDYLHRAGLPPDRVRFFPNFAPEAFFRRPRPSPSDRRLRRLAIVSHHPPEEVKAMARLARRDGTQVDFIGGHRSVFIDETVLPAYDLVVSIGKTAQYCFAQRIPFYCYDHFGGPGYITAENYEPARHGNFCGRSFWRKLTPDALHAEITGSYANALAGLDFLAERARVEFHLERNLASLLDTVLALPPTDIAALRQRHPFAGRLNDVYLDCLRYRLAMEPHWRWRLMRPLQRLRSLWRDR